MFKKRFFIISLILIYWPLSIFFANTPKDFLNYLLPTLLILIAYLLYRRKNQYYLVPTLAIPFIQPKLAVLPLVFVIIDGIYSFKSKKKINKFVIIASLIILMLFFKPFRNQSIFVTDNNSKQEVIQKIHLYPNIPLARLFQNKARIYLDKLNNNFFSLTDPSNYFFGFQPRQISLNNQNLDKYPFLTLIPFLFGTYYFGKNKNLKFILITFIGSILTLSLLTNFDRHDFILWLPISLVIIFGLDKLESKLANKTKYFNFIFVLFGIAQLLRLFVQYLK